MVVQSPLEYPATLTPMEPRAVLAIVDAIAEAGVTLAGVNGDAATASPYRIARSETGVLSQLSDNHECQSCGNNDDMSRSMPACC